LWRTVNNFYLGIVGTDPWLERVHLEQEVLQNLESEHAKDRRCAHPDEKPDAELPSAVRHGHAKDSRGVRADKT
jgi:hypothetical protein